MKRLRFHSKDQKAMFWVNLSMAILPLLLVAYEVTLIPASKVFFFCLFRLVFAVLFSVLTYKMYFHPRNKWYLACAGVAQILFIVHGQCFLPLYFTALVHLTLIYAIIYAPPAKIFWSVTGIGYAIFTILFIRQWNEFTLAMTQVPEGGYIATLLIGFLVTAGIYIHYSRHRHSLEKSALSYGLMGQKTSFVLHDLKNRMMGPVIYMDLLKEHISQIKDDRLHKVVRGLAEDIDKMRMGIQHLQFSHMLVNEEPQEFSLKDSLARLADYLKSRHTHVDLQIKGDCHLVGSRSLVDSIFLNLIINSIEGFKTQGVENPVIHVELKSDCLIYRDNVKTCPVDSEMSLFVIKEAARKMGSRVQFFHENDGTRVELWL
jgi:hypothetical protein